MSATWRRSCPRAERRSCHPAARNVSTLGPRVAERAILALRLDTGIDATFAEGEPAVGEALAWAEAAALLEPFEAGGRRRLRLTERGRLLSNELFARLV